LARTPRTFPRAGRAEHVDYPLLSRIGAGPLARRRNLFIALGTRNVLASALTVGEVARHDVWTCAPDDDVQAALDIMSQRRIRRLPTVEANGHLVGIVSMNDILLAIGGARAVPQGHVIDTLQKISAHGLRVVVPRVDVEVP